jgi:hypothetical protein
MRSNWLFARLLLCLFSLSACGDDGAVAASQTDGGGASGSNDATDTTESDSSADTAGSGSGEGSGGARCGDGACDTAESEADCPEDCSAAPTLLYRPFGDELTVFPDDLYTVADNTTATGRRVQLTAETNSYVANIPRTFRPLFAALSTLDGFGTTGGGYLQFNRPLRSSTVPTGETSSNAGSAMLLGCLDTGNANRLIPYPFETIITEDATVIFRPMVPLPERTECSIVVTRGLLGEDGAPVVAPAVLRNALAGADPALLRGQGAAMRRHRDAAVAAGLTTAEAVVAVVAFTTQSVTDEAIRIAASIASRPRAVTERLGCETGPLFRLCTVRFVADDYRNAAKVIEVNAEATPLGTYDLLATIYLPLPDVAATAPYPTIIFGHGLNGERQQAGRLADFAAPQGIATISIDAPAHGEHPRASLGGGGAAFIEFFGLGGAGFEPLVLRDHWRQAAYDKLALVELLQSGVDADGDGAADLATDHISYLGVSLGGIMGPEFLALTPEVRAAVLVVGGGRVTDILQFSETFSPLVDLLKPSGYDDNDVARFWPLAQTAIDRGDAASFASSISTQRFDGGAPVHLLNAHVLDDDIVPNVSNYALARALGLPQLGTVLRPIGILETGIALPAQGNLDSGATGGTIQFDWVNEGSLETPDWRTATHNNIGDSGVGAHAWLRFLDSWLQTGSATIVDPYVELGLTPPR